MKALEKDRTRRYETANGLARDIERYLEGAAVEAGPPSARYRLSRFARRHRGALATAAAFVLILVVAAAGSDVSRGGGDTGTVRGEGGQGQFGVGARRN